MRAPDPVLDGLRAELRNATANGLEFWRLKDAISARELELLEQEAAKTPAPELDDMLADSSRFERVEYTPQVIVPPKRFQPRACWSPPVPMTPPLTKGDIACKGVTDIVRRYLSACFPAVAHAGGSFWAYEGGTWHELPASWMKALVMSFHRLVFTKDDQGKNRQWEANVTTISSVISLLGITLDAEQLHVQDALGDMRAKRSTIGTFGSRTLYLSEGQVCSSVNAPEFGTQHGFEFEFQAGLEPHYLLSIMRQDWFGGLPEAERELRIQCIREFMGHAMLGTLSLLGIDAMLVCIGSANDGKSVLQSLVRMCLPREAVGCTQIQDIAGEGWHADNAKAQLFGKSANLIDDMSGIAIQENAAFKAAVTGSVISARPVQGKSFSFAPRAVWWGNLNPVSGRLPKLDGRSEGMLRRLVCVQFPRSVRRECSVAKLEERLFAHEQREIVCWAVEAALEMLQTNRLQLTVPGCSGDIKREWLQSSGTGAQRDGEDSVESFLREACERTAEAETRTTDLHVSYCAWVRAMGGSQRAQDLANVSYLAFSKRVSASGAKVVRIRLGSGSQGRVCNVRVRAFGAVAARAENETAPAAPLSRMAPVVVRDIERVLPRNVSVMQRSPDRGNARLDFVASVNDSVGMSYDNEPMSDEEAAAMASYEDDAALMPDEVPMSKAQRDALRATNPALFNSDGGSK